VRQAPRRRRRANRRDLVLIARTGRPRVTNLDDAIERASAIRRRRRLDFSEALADKREFELSRKRSTLRWSPT